ncbi:MAG TPA: RebB family R body protein [Mucilaginibacter sp.]
MPHIDKNLPNEIIEVTEAFTKALAMENHVFQDQLNGSIKMTVDALQDMIRLCKEAIEIGSAKPAEAQQDLTNAVQQAINDVKNAGTQAVTATPPLAATVNQDPPTLDQAVVHALSLSYENLVNAQNQVNILKQSATTQLIMTLISTVTVTVAFAVRDAEVGPSIPAL